MNTVKYLMPDELEVICQAFQADNTYYILGTDSVFCPQLKTRYVDKTSTEEWPNLDGEVVLMTAGECARTELKRFYPDCNFRARKSDFKLLDIAPPMYFTGKQYHGPLYYYDLVGAYSSIYRWLTLDCCWPRGDGEMPLMRVADRLKGWKKARNSLVGVTRAYTMVGVKGQHQKEVRFHNPFFNAHLWRTIQAVLHDIASVALRRGAFYISTDCAMFPNRKGYQDTCALLEGTGFELHKGEGEGDIRGWGSYSISGFRGTARTQVTDTPLNNIQADERTLPWFKKLINYRSMK